MSKKIVGIIGGVGPAATAELFKKVIENTDAAADCDHIRVLIDNNPKIPDRTRAIEEKTVAPVAPMVSTGQGLVELGADFLVIPCVTAHFFYEKIQSALSVPLLNIVEETANFCAKKKITKVGVLATSGTCQTRIFDIEMKKHSIETIYPDDKEQEMVMHIIYDLIKAGKDVNKELFKSCLGNFKKKGTDAVILGCTELPLVLEHGDFDTRFIDVLDVLAKAIVKKAGYKVK